MINIDEIKPYLQPISKFYVDVIQQEVDRIGKDKVFENYFKDIDCSRIIQDYRVQQTIGYPYISSMTQLVYMISKYYDDEEINIRLQQVLEQHRKNLEFEKENPPIIYDADMGKGVSKTTKKKITSDIKRKPKQTNMQFDENGEPIKSAAERKLEAKIGKINALNFKLAKQ